jgi:tripartite ATP-independent transporter DctM subunit
MIRRGYSKGFTCATIAVGSLITATIPPSLGLILYGFVGNVSIGRLFLAGLIPGLLMMAALMGVVYIIASRRGYQAAAKELPDFRAVMRAVADAKWALLFPVALLVGIRGGIFTPSEIGAFAVVYAVVVGVLLHKELTWAKAVEALGEGVMDVVGVIMLIILLSGMVGYALIFEQAPQEVAEWMLGLSKDPFIVILLILFFLLVAGFFVESTVLVLLLTPIFVPIVREIGVDPVHFGILMMSIVTLGSMTPPVGVAMYTVCSILDTTVEEYTREAIPFVAAIIAVVAFLALMPGVVLWLPNLLM